MTNHIQEILTDLGNTADTAKSATWQRLTIRAICEVARQLERIADDGTTAYREPQPLAEDFDRGLSEVSELHDCTQPGRVAGCVNCPDRDDCERGVELDEQLSETAELHDFYYCTQTVERDTCDGCPDAKACKHMAQGD